MTMRAPQLAIVLLLALSSPVEALPPISQVLQEVGVSENTGEKPQSKVWKHDGAWWSVLPNGSGTQLRRLDGLTWTDVLEIAPSTDVHADAKVVADTVHILLFDGSASELVSVEYVDSAATYQAWSRRPAVSPVPIDNDAETATIDIDSHDRMWVAYDDRTAIDVRYSDPPYDVWSDPIRLAPGIKRDDIGMITALPNGTIGVLWSDQETERFGFRVHVDGDDPTVWAADEVPASQSALDVGNGMADDHMNMAVAADATLYAAVKTAYDQGGLPKVSLLVRRPNGSWDDLYFVDDSGTRPIVLLDETQGLLSVVYTVSEGNFPIIYKTSSTDSIAFGEPLVLLSGAFNNATSTKQNISGDAVIVATSASSAAAGVYLSSPALAIYDAGLLEGNAGSTTLNFHVDLSQPIPRDVTFDYTTSDGSATSLDGDYVPVSGTATIPAWTWATTISVQVLGDMTPEANETFQVTLSSPMHAALADTHAAGFIENDDGATAVASATPAGFVLGAISPNPARRAAQIEFTVRYEADVTLSVLDVQGREVAQLAEGRHPAGRYRATWNGVVDGREAPVGVYFVRYSTPEAQHVERLVLLR